MNPVALVTRGRTSGLVDSSPPAWRWAIALALTAATTAIALRIGPALVKT